MPTITKPNISSNTGEGKDRKGSMLDGLKLKWKWTMQCCLSYGPKNDKRRLPCQVCYATRNTKTGHWVFEAVEWEDGYEANVKLNGDQILSEQNLPTRLKAQERAEAMLGEFCEAVLKEIKESKSLSFDVLDEDISDLLNRQLEMMRNIVRGFTNEDTATPPLHQ